MSKTLPSFARIVSVIFHPLFLLIYGFGIIYLINPYLFALQEERDLFLIFFYVAVISLVFPGVAFVMLKALGMVESLDMPVRKQRIVPLIITATFYCWLFINMYNNRVVPAMFTSFVLGATIALFLCFFINLFNKVSLHTAGIGGLTMATFITILKYGNNYVTLPSISGHIWHFHVLIVAIFMVFVMALVGYARLAEKAHTMEQLLGGYMVGILSQVIAMRIIFF